MGNLRTKTDNKRAEIQVLLRHNREEIRRMELRCNHLAV
ncbi:hypothetical protein PF005_g9821 [Phytophthora fragariae]|uniref:Uncharacterized protein n=1 Tax=Phytophthora fragariae TaxID=53985 RepID=A0A6A3UAS0_9STRA|nr:hypothetical protein PF003_g13719 [Phytophthora fragariae]KAE8939138.1 hypothetical protein PF009_g11011 [Phytophthora fragariae]KAE9007008.1 hypothetical protein PF011_g11323 [Phytophthora fragariae]KAE9110468.1 hypothetical protein PF007_g11852 [Phytophthora fragariae]KAE9114249.1 hypothetical protein PF010_g9775 [Phytophthora fragariae]